MAKGIFPSLFVMPSSWLMVREYKTEFFPSKPSESVHAGQTGTGLLEVSQETNLSSPQQYRSSQKPLAIPIHLMDPNKHGARAWPVPRDLHCHRLSHWCGCPRGKSEDGKQTGWLQISRVWSLCYRSPCFHLLEKRHWRGTGGWHFKHYVPGT